MSGRGPCVPQSAIDVPQYHPLSLSKCGQANTFVTSVGVGKQGPHVYFVALSVCLHWGIPHCLHATMNLINLA